MHEIISYSRAKNTLFSWLIFFFNTILKFPVAVAIRIGLVSYYKKSEFDEEPDLSAILFEILKLAPLVCSANRYSPVFSRSSAISKSFSKFRTVIYHNQKVDGIKRIVQIPPAKKGAGCASRDRFCEGSE